MFRKAAPFFFALLLLFFGALPAGAQTVSIDLSTVDSKLAAQILEAQKSTKGTKGDAVTPDRALEWAQFGKHIGEAVAATAKSLSTEVNTFVVTPVGKLVVVLVVWKMIGAQLWSVVGGILMWAVVGYVIWRSFRTFHIPRQVVQETVKTKGWTGKEITKERKVVEILTYKFNSHDARSFSAVVHTALFSVLSLVSVIIIFGS